MRESKKPRSRNRFSYKIGNSRGTFVILVALKGDHVFVPIIKTALPLRLPADCKYEFVNEKDAQAALAILKRVLESPDLYKSSQCETPDRA